MIPPPPPEEFKLEMQKPGIDEEKARINFGMALRPTGNPYKLQEQNTIVNLSGGASSGYQAMKIREAFDGKWPEWIKFVFANTGAEMEETLRFVHEFQRRGFPLAWVEHETKKGESEYPRNMNVIGYNSASRKAEPFEQALEHHNILPGPIRRVCTQDLKVRLISSYARNVLGWKQWSNVIGYRADEAQRYFKLFVCGKDGDISMRTDGNLAPQCPMVWDGVTEKTVADFWEQQDFRLGIPSWMGNCAGCFLKRTRTLIRIEKERPGSLEFFARMEEKFKTRAKKPSGAVFRRDRPCFKDIIHAAQNDIDLEDELDDIDTAQLACECHD